MKELTISARLENIETVTAFVDEQLEEMGCPMKAQMQICKFVNHFAVLFSSFFLHIQNLI